MSQVHVTCHALLFLWTLLLPTFCLCFFFLISFSLSSHYIAPTRSKMLLHTTQLLFVINVLSHESVITYHCVCTVVVLVVELGRV